MINELMGEKIYLRKMTPEDTEQIIAWRNAPHVMERFLIRTPLNEETHLGWIRDKINTGKAVQFVICEKKTGRGVGSFYFHDIDREKQTAELGIFIGEKDALGKGYGTETVKLGIRYGFEELGLDRITLRVLEDNGAAIRNYEKNGFQKIEDKTEPMMIDGQNRGVVFMEREKEGKRQEI